MTLFHGAAAGLPSMKGHLMPARDVAPHLSVRSLAFGFKLCMLGPGCQWVACRPSDIHAGARLPNISLEARPPLRRKTDVYKGAYVWHQQNCTMPAVSHLLLEGLADSMAGLTWRYVFPRLAV